MKQSARPNVTFFVCHFWVYPAEPRFKEIRIWCLKVNHSLNEIYYLSIAELSRILSRDARKSERACATDTTFECATGNVIISRGYFLSECVVVRRLARCAKMLSTDPCQYSTSDQFPVETSVLSSENQQEVAEIQQSAPPRSEWCLCSLLFWLLNSSGSRQ